MSRAGGSRKVPVRYTNAAEHSALLQAAVRAHRKGLLAEAQDKYEQRLHQEPNCLDAWMNLGALEARAGRAQEASDAFARAAILAPTDGRVFRDIGVGLHMIGRLEEATAALERSVECAPELVGSWLHLARTRLEVGPRRLAIAAATNAVALRPDDPSALFMLARCAFDADAPGQALDALRRAGHSRQPYPEAELFRWLLTWHHQASSEVAHWQESFTRSLSDLEELTREHPRLRALTDALRYIQSEMSGARLFSSARDTLRFAALHAPAQGSFVELGVFHGASLRWLARFRPGAVHGFDSFVGLPTAWAPVAEGMFTTAGRVPSGINARFWVGPFAEQLPRFVAEHGEPIALLHVDSDLYESAHCGLSHLGPLLGPGSVLIFDEYLGHRSWRQDEFRAFQEAAKGSAWHYEHLAVNPFTGQVVLRLRDG